MPAARNFCRASWAASWPSQLVRIGGTFLGCGACAMASSTACAASVEEASAVGQFITRMPSAFGSASTASSVALYRSGPASPIMSIGLARDQLAGSTLSSAFTRSSPTGASLPSSRIKSSTASTPAPPPLVTIRSSLPATGCKLASVSAALNSSSNSSTRTSPARRKAALTAASVPASAPVWVAAAFAAAALRPDLIAITGLARAAERAADMNLRAAGIVSRYSRMALVETSAARKSSRSPTSTSAMSPMDTT